VLLITLDPTTIRVGLAGKGEAMERRRRLLGEGGVEPVMVEEGTSLEGLNLLFVAGMDGAAAASLAGRARALGILVNVEDVLELCNFHVPAIVRRGDLAFTVSTNGKAPGLSRLLRERLEQVFGPEWERRTSAVATARAGWRAEGLAPDVVSRRTRDLVAREGWL
jgi:precorrin-2 dehydrogenase / sirohydrochlorin ferrochelatase